MIWIEQWRAIKFLLLWGAVVLLGVLGGLEQIEEAPNPSEWPMWVQTIVVGLIGYGGIVIAVLLHFLGPVINFFRTLFGRPLFYDIRSTSLIAVCLASLSPLSGKVVDYP